MKQFLQIIELTQNVSEIAVASAAVFVFSDKRAGLLHQLSNPLFECFY
ncbi:hypothetical protein FHS14_006242 [Paenibacillus baekrokdamisoli]|nr:hypothetical protein [Paenibacillus baekrokdamisoli]MBB3073206.1 hypothetical protein [Paenibacillus baekrokdamisoli]